jgi:hypothetical protein
VSIVSVNRSALSRYGATVNILLACTTEQTCRRSEGGITCAVEQFLGGSFRPVVFDQLNRPFKPTVIYRMRQLRWRAVLIDLHSDLAMPISRPSLPPASGY